MANRHLFILAFICFAFTTGMAELDTPGPCHTEPDDYIPKSLCIFPFEYDGYEFDACTDHKDEDGDFWCATKVATNGEYEADEWGVCESTCPHADPIYEGIGSHQAEEIEEVENTVEDKRK